MAFTSAFADETFTALLAGAHLGLLADLTTEIAGTGYARQPIETAFGAIQSEVVLGVTQYFKTNTAVISFGIPGGNWNSSLPIPYVGVYSALSVGTLRMVQSMTPRTALNGARAVRFKAGWFKLVLI